MKINVIGLGEIGSAVFSDFKLFRESVGFELVGTDISKAALKKNETKDTPCSNKPYADADIFIITVYKTEQVESVIYDILPSLNESKTVIVESTIAISKAVSLYRLALDKEINLVSFPHRWNLNDPLHGVCNQKRVMGAVSQKALLMARTFYSKLMHEDFIIEAPTFLYACLSKIYENAHRFMEIAIAQELAESCRNTGFNFDILRSLVNTKWNIDLKEARLGINGKCLPKDAALMKDVFDNRILALCIKLNAEYIKGLNDE